MTDAGGGQPRLLIALPVADEHLVRLREAAPDWSIEPVATLGPSDLLPDDQTAGVTALVTDFAPANLEALTGLAWLQLGSAGYMQVAGLPFAGMGVRVTNASGVNDVPIAEWCLLMMLACERDLPGLLRAQEERAWDRRARFQAELRGKRAGIIGYGGIGREVARLCRAIGLEVWAMNRSPIGPAPHRYAPAGTGDPAGTLPHRAFLMEEMTAFLPHLDYLVLTAALNPRTVGLLGERELRLLPATAVVLNPARAQLIEESALGRALREGWIAGAAIDSHYREPLPPDDPTWDLPNALLTPHISGSTLSPHREARLWDLVARNLARFRAGEPLLNEVPPGDL